MAEGRGAVRVTASRAGLAALTLLVACGDDAAASIDVAVSELAPPGLPTHLSSIELRVTRLEASATRDILVERTVPDYGGGSLRPWVVQVSPERSSDVGGTLFRFRATGYVAGREYVLRQARTTFVAGRRFVLPLRFESACVERACGDEETCSDGRCVDDRLYCEPGAAGVSCSAAPDAGADAPLDGALSADAAAPLDLGRVDASAQGDAATEAGPSDSGAADAADAREPCPSEAPRALDRDRCSAAAAACMFGCGSGRNLDCIQACGDRDGPDCYACVMWNMVGCARERGCEDAWPALACCGDDHGCAVHTCARTDCPTEFTAFFECAADHGNECLPDVMQCLR